MQEDDKGSRPLHRNLDTAYVNLAALLRYLRGRDFTGRVHVLLDEYEAEVLLDGESEPRVQEIDHAAGRRAEGEAALQRLLVRAREPGGQINVYTEGAGGDGDETAPSAAREDNDRSLEPEEITWREVLGLSGELIAAVERAALSFKADFDRLFRDARLELAEDYPFLDPTAQHFRYAHARVHLSAEPGTNAYLSGISEALRRVVDRLVSASRAKSVRERVALELAVLARRRQALITALRLTTYLDRIAGTRVL